MDFPNFMIFCQGKIPKSRQKIRFFHQNFPEMLGEIMGKHRFPVHQKNPQKKPPGRLAALVPPW